MSVEVIEHNLIRLMDEKLQLLAEGVIYMPERSLLLFADVHLGKDSHFRKHGIPLPGNISAHDISTMQLLIETVNPKEVIILGDLFHSEYNEAWRLFCKLIEETKPIRYTLVKGNHDILDEEKYVMLEVVDKYEIGRILCTHEPLDVTISGKYNLCGHIHPGVRLRGKGKQSLRLPCFYFGKCTGILPPFGTFTGLHTIKPVEEDKVFVIADGEVSQVR